MNVLKEVLCFYPVGMDGRIVCDGVLMPFSEVAEDVKILMAFYNPDDLRHYQTAKELQRQGVHLVAMVDVNDKRELPKYAQAMICCDDAELVCWLIVGALSHGDGIGLVVIDFHDLLVVLQGVLYHQRFIGTGDHRARLIDGQLTSITLKPKNLLCLTQADGIIIDEWDELLDNDLFFRATGHIFCAIQESVHLQNEMMVDLLYSLA